MTVAGSRGTCSVYLEHTTWEHVSCHWLLTVLTCVAIPIRQGVFDDFMISAKQRVLVNDPYRKLFADLWDK
jgi:hypothetical protein